MYVDSSLAWMTALPFYPAMKSLSVDKSEQNAYLSAAEDPISVVKLNATSGSVNSVQKFSTISGAGTIIKIHLLSDNSGYFILSSKYPTLQLNICKHVFSSPTDAQCQNIPSISDYPQGQLMLNDNQFFFIGVDSSVKNSHFFKISYSQQTTDWVKMMECSPSNCYGADFSESLLSSDSSKIYVFASLGEITQSYAYFMTFNSSDGSLIGSRYKSSINCYYTMSSTIYGDLIIAIELCRGFNIIMYNTTTSAFKIMTFPYYTLNSLCVEKPSGRLVVVGEISSEGYIAKFLPNNIDSYSYFKPANWSMNLQLPGTNDITSDTSYSISTLTSEPVSVGSYTNQTLTYFLLTSSTTDVYMRTDTQSIIVAENTNLIITPDLTCSLTGSTYIYYGLGSFNGAEIPSWISIDPNTGIMNISAPDVGVTTDYYFYVNSVVTGVINAVQKIIKLTIINCAAENCKKCSNSINLMCATCESGYYVDSGKCTAYSESSKALTTTTQSATGVAAGLVVASSLINTSSLSSMWSMVNQVQVFFLLLLSRAFIPEDVKAVITGSSFMQNLPALFDFNDIEFYNTFIGNFNFQLTNDLFEPLNLKSNSTIYNTSSIFVCIVIFALIHYIIKNLRKCIDKIKNEGRCTKVLSIIKWIIKKSLEIFTYGYYIRYSLQMYQFLIVSSMYELYTSDTSQNLKALSFLFALILFSLCIVLIITAGYLSLSSYEVIEGQHNKIGELFDGLKMQKKRKLYVPLMLFRRLIFVILLISLITIPSKILIGLLVFIQLMYAAYILIVRPFKEVKNNIIECINEIYFSILLGVLIILNEKDNWSPGITTTYVYFISSNTIAIFIVVLTDTVRNGIIKLRTWLNRPKTTQTTPIQEPSVIEDRIMARRGTQDADDFNIQDANIQDTNIQRNDRYLYEESKIVEDENISQIQFAQKLE